jgi:hypothetical protein
MRPEAREGLLSGSIGPAFDALRHKGRKLSVSCWSDRAKDGQWPRLYLPCQRGSRVTEAPLQKDARPKAGPN